MTIIAALLVGILALVTLLALAGYIVSRSVVRSNAAKASVTLGPAGHADFEESAALQGPGSGRGFGVLRLTARELLFANGATGAITRIDRGDIVSAGPTQDVDGAAKPLKRPALIVTARTGEVMVVAVTDVAAWVRRIG